MKTMLLAFLLTGCSQLGPVGPTEKRCDFANPSYSAQVAAHKIKIDQTCDFVNNRPVASCPALVEAKAWAKKECAK